MWPQADIDRAKSAWSKGALKLRLSNGEEVTFTDGDDFLRRIRIMEADNAGTSNGGAKVTYPRTSRGL